jgi:hypothetical protein
MALRRAGFSVLRFKTQPVPTSSVRNVHGVAGYWARLPAMLLMSVVGQTDGTTLVAMARRPV